MNRFYIIIIFLIGLLTAPLSAQESNYLNKNSKNQLPAAQVIFNQIEKAISSGNVAALSQYFCRQTYFSLSNGVSGYYSSNQAYYILEDYFKIYQVISFKFRDVQADENNPYATGNYNFEFKGKRDVSRVYISLKNKDNNWKITQITIN